jgi:hypothetical protein
MAPADIDFSRLATADFFGETIDFSEFSANPALYKAYLSELDMRVRVGAGSGVLEGLLRGKWTVLG